MSKKNSKPQTKKDKDSEKLKKAVIDTYANIVASGFLFPTRALLAEAGISRDKLRHHFLTVKRLREATKEAHPELFAGVVNEEEMFSVLARKELKTAVKKHKRYLITTAVNGQQVNLRFLESARRFCKANDALMLILPCHDPAHNLDNEVEWHFDENIVDHMLVFERLDLNSNIHISSIRITAKQINPHTGLGRFVQGQGSAIFGSPKQNLDYIPVSNVKYPHALMSTGAITVPNYNTSRGNSLRSAFIAEHDHIMGALIVEVEDDKYYHFRQIQADKDGSFIDLGKQYSEKGIVKVEGTTLIMGDYHAGQQDPSAVKAWKELAIAVGVSEVIFHDLFNGNSISHHTQHQIVTLARMAKDARLSLAEELRITADVLREWSKYKRVVVKSNHDEFLDRWIQDARFKHDPYNFQAGCRIADRMIDGEDPLVVGLITYGKMLPGEINPIKFLKRDEDYKIAGIESGAHGDKGPNGSRGSKANLENAYGKATIGHSHTPGILRGVWQVGTTTLFDLEYNIGPSSWMHCSCLTYPNGQRQLINSINGHWRLKK